EAGSCLSNSFSFPRDLGLVRQRRARGSSVQYGTYRGEPAGRRIDGLGVTLLRPGAASARRLHGSLHDFDDFAAYHHRIGALGKPCGAFRIAYAESDAHGYLHVAADDVEATGDVFGIEMAGSRHPLERHVIDVTAGDLCHGPY